MTPRSLFGLAAVLLLISACSSNPTPSAPTLPPATPTRTIVFPTPPAGWVVHAKPTFQLALPETWQEIALDDGSLKRAIESAENSNPHLADALNAILMSGQSKTLALYAVDASSSNSVVNVSVARIPLQNQATAEQIARQYADALPQAIKGGKLVATQAPLEVNGSPAAEVDYDVPLVNAAGELVTLRGVQFLYLPSPRESYVLTVSGNAADSEKLMPLARQIGNSFVGVGP